MHYILKFTLLVALGNSGLSLAANQCEVQSPLSNPRFRMVELQDGRRIYVLEHNHGDRELPFQLSKLAISQEAAMTNAIFEKSVEGLRQSVSGAVAQAAGDIEDLRQLLNDEPAIQFVGVESTNEVAQNNLAQLARLQDGFKSALRRRGLAEEEADIEVSRVALGPVNYLAINEPSLFVGRSILGFENPKTLEEASAAEVSTDALRAELSRLGSADKEFISNVNGTELTLWRKYPEYSVERDEARLLAALAAAPMREDLREPTRAWLSALLKEFAALKRRETDVARGLIAHGGSGILVMGADHVDALMEHLRRLCLQPSIF